MQVLVLTPTILPTAQQANRHYGALHCHIQEKHIQACHRGHSLDTTDPDPMRTASRDPATWYLLAARATTHLTQGSTSGRVPGPPQIHLGSHPTGAACSAPAADRWHRRGQQTMVRMHLVLQVYHLVLYSLLTSTYNITTKHIF